MVKKQACVFISGKGSNLKALIKSSREYNFPVNISCVVTNSKIAEGINIAKLYNIPYYILSLDNQLNLESLLLKLKRNNISLICLAGYLKILKKNFIRKFNGKIINIHPSLLPKYKGLNTFKRVLSSKEKVTGCTVHYVSNKLDSGKIILQKKIVIGQKDNEKTLKAKVQQAEYKIYSESIVKIFK